MIFVVAALAAALVLLAGAVFRVSRNVGPMDLEAFGRAQGCVFIPVSRQLVDGLAEWSNPCRIRLENHRHPLLVTLIVENGPPTNTGA